VLLGALVALTLTADAGAAADAGVLGPRALLLLASEPEAFDRWAAAKPSERSKVKGLTDKVKINERTLVAIVLDGYELPKSRRVELNADIVIIDSTGRTVLEKASAATARTFDPATQTAIVLKPIGALNYSVTDPEGVYVAKVTIWDQIRGESAKVVTQFTVTR
jgi:hypothetical protein